jgi:Zn-dependent M28 family amino/carboxypeptidase
VVAALAVVLAFAATACLPRDVGILASDDMAGREYGKPGGKQARDWLVGQLKPFTVGANTSATGNARWVQPFGTGGGNVVGIIRGTRWPDRYVMVGAHYDHLGDHGCRRPDPADTICNGALDNATGVAAVLALMRRMADDPPRRSIIVVLWDGEEKGYVGSRWFAAHPLVPLSRIVTYLNADLIGENLVPGLHLTSFSIGAESGGARLRQLVQSADDSSELDLITVSRLFGQDRSNHASLLNAKVPSVFLGDGGGGCYHTPADEVDVVDFDKLRIQTELLIKLTGIIADTNIPPTWTAGNPPSTYGDVVQFQTVVDRSWPDRDLFSEADQVTLGEARDTVQAIVDAGADAYDDQAQSDFVGAVVDLNTLLGHLPCAKYAPEAEPAHP